MLGGVVGCGGGVVGGVCWGGVVGDYVGPST